MLSYGLKAWFINNVMTERYDGSIDVNSHTCTYQDADKVAVAVDFCAPLQAVPIPVRLDAAAQLS